MEEGSQPPPWATTVQNCGLLCAYAMFILAVIVSFDQIAKGNIQESDIWRALIIIAATISLVKLMVQHTTAINAKLLSNYLNEDERLKIVAQCEEEIRERTGSIRRSGLGDSTAHHEKKLAEAKRILRIVAK